MPEIAHVYFRRSMRYVMEPATTMPVRLEFTNRGDAPATITVSESVTGPVTASAIIPSGPLTLASGASASLAYDVVSTSDQGPALIAGVVAVDQGGMVEQQTVETPFAVYPRQTIASTLLLIRTRERLKAVTNWHWINAHVLVMHPVLFFDLMLNYELAAEVQEAIAEEFAFTTVGVPVDMKTVQRFLDRDIDGVQWLVSLELHDTPFSRCDELYETDRVREFSPEANA